MYVSRPVETIRDDPVAGETATLLLRVADDPDPDAVAAAASESGATVGQRLAFDTLQVTVAHENVAVVRALDGLDAVETAGSLTMDLDGGGEDVAY